MNTVKKFGRLFLSSNENESGGVTWCYQVVQSRDCLKGLRRGKFQWPACMLYIFIRKDLILGKYVTKLPLFVWYCFRVNIDKDG